jgi:hypothetical protein
MPNPVLILNGFPRCPTCQAEAHELTFSPAIDAQDTRVLSDQLRVALSKRPQLRDGDARHSPDNLAAPDRTPLRLKLRQSRL